MATLISWLTELGYFEKKIRAVQHFTKLQEAQRHPTETTLRGKQTFLSFLHVVMLTYIGTHNLVYSHILVKAPS